MEEKKEEVVESNKEESEVTEVTETVTEETKVSQPKNDATKTFTQEEVNEIVEKRLKKFKSNVPSDDELKKFKEWKDSQKTNEEKLKEAETELQKTNSENTDLKNEIEALKAGVSADDLDYVMFKVSKMEGEFADNLKTFIEANPKVLGKEEVKASGIAVKQAPQPKSGVIDILSQRHKDIEF